MVYHSEIFIRGIHLSCSNLKRTVSHQKFSNSFIRYINGMLIGTIRSIQNTSIDSHHRSQFQRVLDMYVK